MMVLNTPEFKVGVMVVIVSSIIGVMSLRVAEGPGLLGGSKQNWFEVDDAGGLVKNSAVKMAGIKVGIIEAIELVNGRAKVKLLIDEEVPLTISSIVELRADGILGDKHVELITQRPGDPVLEDGQQILKARDKGSLDQIMNEVGKITDSLGALAENLNLATQGEGNNSTTLGRIILNIESLTRDLSEMSGKNKKKINDIVDRVHNITGNMDEFLDDDSPDGFKAAWQKAIDSLSNIDKSLNNIGEITDKINRGEGTIGRLVNDEETVEKINETIDSVNDFVGGAGKLETALDFHSEYMSSSAMTKSILNVKIIPGLDRYYEVGIVDDGQGVIENTLTTTTPPGNTIDERKVYKDRIKFNALFAKNFYNFTVKGGIIESSAGVGFDYNLLGKRLKLSLEAFDFDDLYVRAFARYSFFRGVYLVGGGDNLADENEASAFIGGGIFLTNDDLKLLASKVSF